MYIPKQFEITDLSTIHALIREKPLATVVTLSEGEIVANHIPLQLSTGGLLHGHVARSNPLWRDSDRGKGVLAIFQGSDTYITPNWYATKAESGMVVPTWNYAVVHAHGELHVHDDRDWLMGQLELLTNAQEASQVAPWAVSDAPEDFVEKLTKAIVGIEIVVHRFEAKWKVSQNQSPANQASVIAGLNAIGTEAALSMSELIKGFGEGRSERYPRSPSN